MTKNGFLKKHGIVRNDIKKDMLYFALPAIIVFSIGLIFCAIEGLPGFWGTIWGLAMKPQDLFMLPLHSIIGLALVILGLIIMCVGQITLFRNYSSTIVIKEDHQLITHGIYRFTRNPMYLGLIMVATGLPVYTASLAGFLTMIFISIKPL